MRVPVPASRRTLAALALLVALPLVAGPLASPPPQPTAVVHIGAHRVPADLGPNPELGGPLYEYGSLSPAAQTTFDAALTAGGTDRAPAAVPEVFGVVSDPGNHSGVYVERGGTYYRVNGFVSEPVPTAALALRLGALGAGLLLALGAAFALVASE